MGTITVSIFAHRRLTMATASLSMVQWMTIVASTWSQPLWARALLRALLPTTSSSALHLSPHSLLTHASTPSPHPRATYRSLPASSDVCPRVRSPRWLVQSTTRSVYLKASAQTTLEGRPRFLSISSSTKWQDQPNLTKADSAKSTRSKFYTRFREYTPRRCVQNMWRRGYDERARCVCIRSDERLRRVHLSVLPLSHLQCAVSNITHVFGVPPALWCSFIRMRLYRCIVCVCAHTVITCIRSNEIRSLFLCFTYLHAVRHKRV